MLRAYKYELRPTECQKNKLNNAFNGCRLVYNLALETKVIAYQHGKQLTCFDLINQLPELKNEFEWLKETYSQALQSSISNLDKSFTNFFKGRAKFPKFKNKKSKQSFRIPIPIKVDFNRCVVYLSKYGEFYFNKDRQFFGIVKQATVSKSITGRYFISILVDTFKEKEKLKPITESTTIGIDLGIRHFATLSDGTKIDNPQFLKLSLSKLRREQRSLSRKKKGSNRQLKQRLIVAKIYEKVSNQRKDFLHKTSTEIVNRYDSIAIENLNVSGMIKSPNLSKYISDVGWGTFETFLKYKADWYGKNILQIGRFEPSSKMCSCGKINNELKLSQRIWTCGHCKTTHDRDVLASQNIKKFGLRTQPTNAKVSQ